MQIRGIPWPILRAAELPDRPLSPTGQRRLQALRLWHETGDGPLVSRIFQVSRATLYRWRRQYRPGWAATLEARSRRPHRVRQSPLAPTAVEQIRQLRLHYPRWGREKLRVLLARQGVSLAAKTIDRVLARLRAQGRLVEPPRQPISAHKRRRSRPYAVRKPRDYAVAQPGDLVQVDTLDGRPLPGVLLKQFTARDVVSRWDVLHTYTRATAQTATHFLETLHARMPFPLRALQVDGGPEFTAAFEQACQHRGLRLFVLPPRSPKLNGAVERAQRTHTEEFYECYLGDYDLPTLRAAQRHWEHLYNHVRPHQALGYLTPAEFLRHHPP
jgi:putative transposase